MSRCKSCQAPIGWLETDKNKKPIPVNPGRVFVRESFPSDPDERKVKVLLPTGMIARGIQVSEAEANVINEEGLTQVAAGFISHFATCPNAKEHRRT